MTFPWHDLAAALFGVVLGWVGKILHIKTTEP